MAPARRCLLIACLAIGCVPATAHAQGALANFPDLVVAQFTNMAAGWVGQFQVYARNTFGLLGVISAGWIGIRLALAGASLEEFLAEYCGLLFFLGIGLFALGNGPEFINDIIASFRTLGKVGNGAGMSPGSILTAGLNVINEIWHQVSIWSPSASAGLIIVGCIVILCIAFICACMVVALVQVALYVPVAVLFMAFLGSPWTRDLSMRMLMQSFALGVKLMMLELMAAASLQFVQNMIGVTRDFTALNAGVVMAASLILAFMSKIIPDWMAHAIGGASIGEGGAIRGAAIAAVSAGVGAAAGAVGVGAAAFQAGTLASAQETNGGGMFGGNTLGSGASAEGASGGGGAIGQAARGAGNFAANMASAAATDLGHRLGGNARHGAMGGRMADRMAQQVRDLETGAEVPKNRLFGGAALNADGTITKGANAAAGASGAVEAAAEPWMAESGGYSRMAPEHQESAQRSYDAWSADNPGPAEKYDIEDYVSYAQERAAERRAVSRSS